MCWSQHDMAEKGDWCTLPFDSPCYYLVYDSACMLNVQPVQFTQKLLNIKLIRDIGPGLKTTLDLLQISRSAEEHTSQI